jgi:hypothetical protein
MPAMQRRRNPLLCPPKAITLDIDDTPNVVHGHQQLSLFNAHYDFLYLPSRMSQKSGSVSTRASKYSWPDEGRDFSGGL